MHELAHRKIQSLQGQKFENPLLEIGLPEMGIAPRMRSETQIQESALGRRVSEEERLENLQALVALCRERDIDLVILHPSYGASKRHECLLTRFCRDHEVLMFEVYDTLHAPGLSPLRIYRDPWHPRQEGHLRLAQALCSFLHEHGLPR